MLVEMISNLTGRPRGLEHDEAGLRVDGSHHPRVGLIQKLLPIIHITAHSGMDVGDIVKSCNRCPRSNGVQIVGEPPRLE